MRFTEQLCSALLLEEAILSQFAEDVLCDPRLELRRGLTELVEADVEPLVYVGMDEAVLVAELLRCAAFGECPGFCRCSVFVRSLSASTSKPSCPSPRVTTSALGTVKQKPTADIQRVDASSSAVSCKDIRREHASDDVTEMRNIVHVW